MNTDNASAATARMEAPRPQGPSATSHRLYSAISTGASRLRSAKRYTPIRVSPEPEQDFSDVWATFGAVPEGDFLRDLSREKRRSDRTKAPLSLILYPIDDDARRTIKFLELLHAITRETDIIGPVGDGMIGLLCPDTDAAGASDVLRKVDAASAVPVTPLASVTHPDLLFEKLGKGTLQVGTSASPIDLTRIDRLPPAVVADRPGRERHGYPLKRWIDVSGSLIGIVALAPVMLIAALAIAATSHGPLIFRQTRLGQNGKPFVFYKFRTMVVNGDDRVHRAYVEQLITKDEPRAHEGGSPGTEEVRFYKIKHDPRVTPVGRLLRKTSIDELPQLFNVLTGDMSLVGPRPPISYEAAKYQAWHLRRLLSAKPGLTGLWQVEGRSRVSFNEMVRMDLRYIRDCSLAMDLGILLKTVRVVLRCEGAA